MSGGNRLHYPALGLGLALATAALGQEPAALQKRPDQSEKTYEATKRQAAAQATIEAPRAAPPITPAKPAGEDHDADHSRAEKAKTNQALFQWKAWVTLRDTLAQWFMALFGGIATIISIWAVILLGKTLRATREAVEESRRATAAAEAAVKVTSDTARRELRAYIHVVSAEIKAMGFGSSPNVILNLRNFGKTPAYEVRHALTTSAFLQEEENFDTSNLPSTNHGDLGPGQDIFPRKIVDAVDWASKRHEVADKARKLYVFGEVRYFDVFGAERKTVYRLYLFVDDDGIADGDLSLCEDGNETT